MPIRFIVLGRPGSGKGTQGAELSRVLGVPHLSAGDLLRAEIDTESPLGREAGRYVAAGRLVPDGIVASVLRARLATDDVRQLGFILDGYPRSVAQAIALERAVAPGRITWALELLVSEREAAHRLLARIVCRDCGHSPHHVPRPGAPATPTRCPRCGGPLRRRPDDEVSAIRRRFEEFERLTKPLLEWLDRRGLLVTIDADRPAGEVTEETLGALDRLVGLSAARPAPQLSA